MNKSIVLASVAIVIFAVGFLFLQDSMATGASVAEDQIVGIMERILNVIADFLEKIFNSIADAIKRVWTPSE